MDRDASYPAAVMDLLRGEVINMPANSGQNYNNQGNRQNNHRQHQNNDNRRQNSDNRRQNNDRVPYLGAPYNFVAIGDKVIPCSKEEIPAHNSFQAAAGKRSNEKLYSGEISYTVTAKTDIFVGGQNGKDFYRAISGRYAVPGSSIRGLIRGNMQILSLSSIADDVDDYKLMYRKVAETSPLGTHYKEVLGVGPVPTEGGNSISICKNVQAGYLLFDGKNYKLIEIPGAPIGNGSGSKQNYYTLRENTIINQYRKSSRSGTENPYAYLIEIAKEHLMYRTDARFESGGTVSRGSENRYYRPSIYPISFKVGANNQIEKVAAPGKLTGSGCQEGYILSSGFMNRKKTHYIIPSIGDINDPGLRTHELKNDGYAITAYKRDYQAKEKLLGTTSKLPDDKKEKEKILAEIREFYKLPEKKGEYRPVFFIEVDTDSGKNYHFGFTPYQRLFYEHTVKDGIPDSHKNTALDYTKAILGYSSQKAGEGENESRKGRVSFEDAELVLPKGKTAENHLLKPDVQLTLASPKPTSFLDYLTQDERNSVTYNSNNFTLRGYKQYWLHEKEAQTAPTNRASESSFRPLSANSTFSGVIRFNNLYADELGLLLWSLRLEKNSHQNLGKAKAYGFGRIQVTIDDLKLFDPAKMYDSLTLDFEPYVKNQDDSTTDEEVEKWIQLYKEQISQKLGADKNIMDEPGIKQFLLMKDGSKLPAEDKIKYMSIANKDYQNRRDRLPFPEEIMGQTMFQPLPASEKQQTGGRAAQSGRTAQRGRAAQGNPGNTVASTGIPSGKPAVQVKVDAIVTGKVKQTAVKKDKKTGRVIEKFGAFVSLPENHQGLLHKNNMKYNVEYYTPGKEIQVKITDITDKGIALWDKEL